MTKNAGSLTLIDDLVAEMQQGESTLVKKSNTVTAAIGSLITILLTGGSYWLESGTEIPSWLPGAVLILGMLATTYGVSKTKNGITDSVATRLHQELAHRIDLTHYHGPESSPIQIDESPSSNQGTPALTLREAADAMVARDSDRN